MSKLGYASLLWKMVAGGLGIHFSLFQFVMRNRRHLATPAVMHGVMLHVCQLTDKFSNSTRVVPSMSAGLEILDILLSSLCVSFWFASKTTCRSMSQKRWLCLMLSLTFVWSVFFFFIALCTVLMQFSLVITEAISVVRKALYLTEFLSTF